MARAGGKENEMDKTLCETCALDTVGLGCKYACTGVTEFDADNEIVVACDDYKERPLPDSSAEQAEIEPAKPGLHEALNDWMAKVLSTYASIKANGGSADTLRMLQDVDKVLAEAFDRDTVL